MEGIEVAPGLGKLGTKHSVGRFLGKGGYAEVYEGADVQTGERVAIKFVNEKGLVLIKDEINAMMSIQHENVLRGIEFSINEHDFTDQNGHKQEKVNYLITELAREGELFDWICFGGCFQEPLAR